VRYEIVKAELERRSDVELRKMARSLNLKIEDRAVLIEKIALIMAPRGPERKKREKGEGEV
jgi:hypothetical protein